MSDKSINSLEEKKTMITFILGMLAGAVVAMVLLSLIVAGKNSDLQKENDRLKHRVQDQARRLFSSWHNWVEEKDRCKLLERANEELGEEINQVIKEFNLPANEDKIPPDMYLSRM